MPTDTWGPVVQALCQGKGHKRESLRLEPKWASG